MLSEARTFLRRHFFWAIVIAVLLPLLTILVVQYRSLRKLEQTLPVYRREIMAQYLRSVTSEVADWYRTNAERMLAVPADAISNQRHGVIQNHGERAGVLAAVARVAAHFKQQELKGAKRVFVVVQTQANGSNRNEVIFYHPARQVMELDLQSPETEAINTACDPYMARIQLQLKAQPYLTGVSQGPNTLLIIKPIIDQEEKMVGLAGMVVDQEYLAKELISKSINDALPKFFPLEYSGVVVTLQTPNQPALNPKPEASQRFNPFFYSYLLGISMRNTSVEQLARQNFILNLSLSLAMTLLLVGALVLAFRVVTREMRLSQMKTDFVANVSHELRTPLASIRVFAELLKLGRVKDPNMVCEYGSYLEILGRRLTQVINNILDFSRIESGQKKYQFELTDLREMVTEALETLAGELQRSGHRVAFEISGEPPPLVLLDYDAMIVALTNLLDNAIKYSGNDKQIEVRLETREGCAAITVRDHGIGIAREEQEKIFEKFYRVSTGMVHDIKGSGLGLSIVKHIIAAHHGRITVESEPGRGSAFTLHLPLVENGKQASTKIAMEKNDA